MKRIALILLGFAAMAGCGNPEDRNDAAVKSFVEEKVLERLNNYRRFAALTITEADAVKKNVTGKFALADIIRAWVGLSFKLHQRVNLFNAVQCIFKSCERQKQILKW